MNERTGGEGGEFIVYVYIYIHTYMRVLSHDERQKEKTSESVIVHTQVRDKR
jgi:hypothetical protein